MSAQPIVGQYNRQGYQVIHGSRVIYSAGNHPLDSQQPADPEVALTLPQIRWYCRKTCKELAEERQAPFGDICRVEDE